jgi:predicted nucleic acid-binding protein
MRSALGLSAGESDALGVMEGESADLMLCEDAAARLAGETLGFVVRGTLGVIVRSIRQGRRDWAGVLALLTTLRERSTLYVSKSVLDGVIEVVARE